MSFENGGWGTINTSSSGGSSISLEEFWRDMQRLRAQRAERWRKPEKHYDPSRRGCVVEDDE